MAELEQWLAGLALTAVDFAEFSSAVSGLDAKMSCHAEVCFCLLGWRGWRYRGVSKGDAMFFRQKRSADRVYLQIVENERVYGRVRQRVLATVGRMDELAATGALDRLLASGARFSEHAMLISALAADAEGPRLHCRRIGGPLVFGRLWEETGCRAV